MPKLRPGEKLLNKAKNKYLNKNVNFRPKDDTKYRPGIVTVVEVERKEVFVHVMHLGGTEKVKASKVLLK